MTQKCDNADYNLIIMNLSHLIYISLNFMAVKKIVEKNKKLKLEKLNWENCAILFLIQYKKGNWNV